MKEKKSVIIGNADIFTLGKNNRQIKNGAIFAEDGIIKKIGETAEIRKIHPDAEFIDMNGHVMLPGNIIAHTHLYSSFARGMSLKDDAPSNFTEILERLWWRLDKVLTEEDNYYSAMAYLLQCIKYGTTTFIDHHASPKAIKGSLDIIEKAVLDSGIRASLCYEITDRGGEEESKEGIRENARFAEKLNNSPSEFVKAAFGLHASFTVSNETLSSCIEEAENLKTPLHIHVEEDMADRRDSELKYGVPVITRLRNMKATNLPILAAHCVHADDSEIEIIKENNIKVVHNPSSNMNNAVGVAPVIKMLDKGIPVGLGTDGMSADLFQEIKILPLLHKISTGDPRTYSFDKLYETIFINGASAASLFWKEAGLGSIEEGNYADVIGLDYNAPTPVNAGNILGHIIFGINSSMVDTTIVHGKVLMKNRKILNLDEEKIMAKCRELAANLWERF